MKYIVVFNITNWCFWSILMLITTRLVGNDLTISFPSFFNPMVEIVSDEAKFKVSVNS